MSCYRQCTALGFTSPCHATTRAPIQASPDHAKLLPVPHSGLPRPRHTNTSVPLCASQTTPCQHQCPTLGFPDHTMPTPVSHSGLPRPRHANTSV
eukprot:g29918.t1